MASLQSTWFRGRVHLPFLGLAFFLGTFGGLALAAALPLTAMWRGSIGTSWVEHAQVHGHLQAVGFVGLFIMGVSYRIFPAWAGRPVPSPALVVPSFWLVATGVIARAAGQPVADIPWGAALFVASAWLELAGLVLFAINVLRLVLPASRGGAAYWPFIAAGATWFVVQAALGAWWVTATVREGGTVLPVARDSVVVFLQFFGVHVMFILGVGLRAFPTFFAAGALPTSQVRAAWVLAQLGITTVAAVGIARQLGLEVPWVSESGGFVLLGLGLAWSTTFTGFWRPPSRIRPASRPSAYLLQPAMAWLVLAGLLLVGFAVFRGLNGEGLQTLELDATRHMVGVGVVLTTIVGMAQMILPEFAGERLLGRQSAWRGVAFGLALVAATALRAGARLFSPWLPSAVVWWSMSVAGLLALLVIGSLGYYFWRGVRSHGLVLEAAARFGERSAPPR
ncbi:MAG: NnrS family protein [Dehalococcoidia bacterium]|nr:NnrS family protein [Dehalococcoidia bacterium]